MINIKRKVITGIATGALVANAIAPIAFAGTTIEISGNGAGSDNWVDVTQESKTVVNQNNTANVVNKVDADASTGGNDANYNTGGNVTIDTGKANVEVDVSNTLNSNTAEVNCCASGDTEVKIDGNGAKTDNVVKLYQASLTKVDQHNKAKVSNYINADATTGYNDANGNTGGDVTVMTGDADVDVSVSTMANVNSAVVKSSNGGNNPSATFIISGNGAGSDNFIGAWLTKKTVLHQDNAAKIKNAVHANAKTGKNDANYNTGGDVVIETGDADVVVMIDNAVNFNHADIDCGCSWDVTAKISGNGAEGDSQKHGKKPRKDLNDNVITLNLDSLQKFDQNNYAGLNNYVDGDAKTGYNDAELNTGESDGDPTIITGNADSDTSISNSGNVNSIGDSLPFNWPDFPTDTEFSFSLGAFWAFFGLSL